MFRVLVEFFFLWWKSKSVCVCQTEREKGRKAGETFCFPGVLPDASGSILSVTAQVIEAKSAPFYLLCRTIIRRAADATFAALVHSEAETDCTCFTTLGNLVHCPLPVVDFFGTPVPPVIVNVCGWWSLIIVRVQITCICNIHHSCCCCCFDHLDLYENPSIWSLSFPFFNRKLTDLSSCRFFISLWSTDDNETLCLPLHAARCSDDYPRDGARKIVLVFDLLFLIKPLWKLLFVRVHVRTCMLTCSARERFCLSVGCVGL